MGTEFAGSLHAVAFLAVKVVDRADVVETTASDEVSRRRISTGHDPTGAKRDGVDFVGGVGIPDDEFSILRRGNEMAFIGCPVHGVNLCKMTTERAPGSHNNTRKSVDLGRHGTNLGAIGGR